MDYFINSKPQQQQQMTLSQQELTQALTLKHEPNSSTFDRGSPKIWRHLGGFPSSSRASIASAASSGGGDSDGFGSDSSDVNLIVEESRRLRDKLPDKTTKENELTKLALAWGGWRIQGKDHWLLLLFLTVVIAYCCCCGKLSERVGSCLGRLKAPGIGCWSLLLSLLAIKNEKPWVVAWKGWRSILIRPAIVDEDEHI